jgi:hypothetical protein
MYAGRADRGHGDINPRLVEIGDRATEAPPRWRDAAGGVAFFVRCLPIEVWNRMLMEINGQGHGSPRVGVRWSLTLGRVTGDHQIHVISGPGRTPA